MKNLAARNLQALPAAAAAADYLGPAEVLDDEAGHDGERPPNSPCAVRVVIPGGPTVRAEIALALPYLPTPGDLMLVIGRAGAYYVIGVLHGAGRTELAIPGDIELRAVGGKLRLSGDKGVELSGPEVEIRGGTLRVLADAALQQFASLCQRVTSVLSVHAGESHTVVAGASLTQAKTAAMLTEGTMTINGKEIHLG
jgi:Protein of unknown function (DUF3540)